MKRRTLDVIVSASGVVVAAVLLVAGFVLQSNANFAKNYVADQFAQQGISFTALDELSDEERQSACLVEYAGQPLSTGKQAECYANDYIGLHLQKVAGGNTYASQGDVINGLKAELAAAQKATPVDQAKVDDLTKQVATANAQRETLFKGEMLRGTLLTSYGFSELGSKAGQGALVAFTGSGLVFLLALLGFWHAARTPETVEFAPATKA
jgi:hypothetical protein